MPWPRWTFKSPKSDFLFLNTIEAAAAQRDMNRAAQSGEWLLMSGFPRRSFAQQLGALVV